MAPKEEAEEAPKDGTPEETQNTNEITQVTEGEEEEKSPTCGEKLCAFYWDNEFLILVVIVILLARAYPPLGADYLQPNITSTWIAVVFIFVLAGLGLKTEEFSKALQRLKFNLFVQLFNFCVVSSIVFGISRGLVKANAIDQGLADGMVVCASLPMTINMVLVLTKASGGDDASAIFNAAFGNMLGVFFSPVLILGYLGVTGNVDLLNVFFKLALRVVLPVAIGQILQKTSQPVVQFVKKHKKHFKTAQQYSLVFIVYTVFCRTFEQDNQTEIVDIFVMILVQLIQLVLLMVLAWFSLKIVFPSEPKLQVMGLFGCTHKTVAMGVPLINAIYESDPLVGLYTLPLLIWHPMQLLLGTFLSPRLSAYVDLECERLGINNKTEEEENNDGNNNETNNHYNGPKSEQSLQDEITQQQQQHEEHDEETGDGGVTNSATA